MKTYTVEVYGKSHVVLINGRVIGEASNDKDARLICQQDMENQKKIAALKKAPDRTYEVRL